jgi:uncharacterized protein YhaN
MVEVCSAADHSPTASDFGQEIEKARSVARDLERLVSAQCLTCQAEIQDFLDTANRVTRPEYRPEDRELIGLTEWAAYLHDQCLERDMLGNCAKDPPKK